MSNGGAAGEDDITGAQKTPGPAPSVPEGEAEGDSCGGGRTPAGGGPESAERGQGSAGSGRDESGRGGAPVGPDADAVGRGPEPAGRDRDSAVGEQTSAGPEEAAADGSADAVGSGGRFARLRKRRVLASTVALAVVAGGAAVPLALGVWDPSCKELPAATRELAKNPVSATRALDPRDDMSRYDAVRALLPSGTLCGDGGRVLGQVMEAATGASAPGKPHTTAQSRVVYAVSAIYHEAEVPPGAEPGLARVLAGYVADTTAFTLDDPDAATPAASGAQAAPDQAGWSRFGRFLAPGEAHPEFGFDYTGTLTAEPGRLFAELARNPEAFAILYDAERAYLAHYLERLTAQGTDPGYRREKEPGEEKTRPTLGPDNDLKDIARRIGTLMYARAKGARDGDITDLGSFDASARRHTRGAYQAAPRQVSSRPSMGSIALRPVSGPAQDDLMDARRQLFLTVDAWAKARKVPSERASAIRQLLDDSYLGAYRYGPT